MSVCRWFPALVCLLTCAACGPTDESDRGDKGGPLRGRFYLSDEFSPSGHMGDGENPGFITANINENCLSSDPALGPTQRPPGAGGDCYKFVYKPDIRASAEKWGGVYWVYPSNGWGSRPGRNLIPPYKRVRFKAAAAPRNDPDNPPLLAEYAGQPRISFLVGGIGTNAADPQPYSDALKQQAVKNAFLTPQWQDLEILLADPNKPDNEAIVTGMQPFQMISAFCWTAGFQPGVPTANTPPTILYIDDIVWDNE